MSGVPHSSFSAFPAIYLLFTFSISAPSYIAGFHLLHQRSQLYIWSYFLLHQCSPLYIWGSFFYLFLCVLRYVSGVHYSSSFSTFTATSLGFTFFFFCIPSDMSGVHHSWSPSTFPAVSLGFTILHFFVCVPSCCSGIHHSSLYSEFAAVSVLVILLRLLRPQLYLWGSPSSFSSSVFQAVYLGFTILLLRLRSQL